MKATVKHEYRNRSIDNRLVLTIQVMKAGKIIDSESFLASQIDHRKQAADYIRRNRFLYN